MALWLIFQAKSYSVVPVLLKKISNKNVFLLHVSKTVTRCFTGANKIQQEFQWIAKHRENNKIKKDAMVVINYNKATKTCSIKKMVINHQIICNSGAK